MDEARRIFYETRMLPLEIAHARKARIVWFGIGMAFAALLVSAMAVLVASLR